MGLGTGEAGPHEQPGIRQMDRRESWCQEDVDALVNKAYESFEAANRTTTALRIEISCLEHKNQRLKDEVSQLEEQADDLIDERDRLQRTVIHLAASHTEPRQASATPTEKSVKIPNPPVLTNGKDPEFEDWESRIRNKLKANADHYNTEVLRISYVENRTGGKAAKHLRPRLRVNAVNPYITAEEMLKHLESIFQDPNREANSKREFRKLNMGATDKFQDFLTDFLYLAGEAKIPATMYKDELYQRMTWKLQEMTIRDMMDSDIGFDAFTGICTRLADHLVVINESRNQDRQRSQSNTPIPGTSENTRAPTSRTEARNHEGTPTSRTVSASRTIAEELATGKREPFRSGKCFSCEIFGHIARDCPRKRMEREMKPTQEQSKERVSLGKSALQNWI